MQRHLEQTRKVLLLVVQSIIIYVVGFELESYFSRTSRARVRPGPGPFILCLLLLDIRSETFHVWYKVQNQTLLVDYLSGKKSDKLL